MQDLWSGLLEIGMNIFFSALGIQSVIGGKKNSFDDLPISDGKTASHQEKQLSFILCNLGLNLRLNCVIFLCHLLVPELS